MATELSSIDISALLQSSDASGLAPDVEGYQGFQRTHMDRERKLGYWRRCTGCASHQSALGYIMVGPDTSRNNLYEVEDFRLSKHATLLKKEYFTNSDGKSATAELLNPITRWRPLIRAGGIHEMPIEQMVEQGFHRIKSWQDVFPELKEVEDIKCEHGCPTTGYSARLFTNQQSYLAHIQVVHKDVSAPKAIGDVLAKYVNQPQGYNTEALIDAMTKSFASAMSQVMETKAK